VVISLIVSIIVSIGKPQKGEHCQVEDAGCGAHFAIKFSEIHVLVCVLYQEK
jgi:hypothetical protein